MQLHHGQIVENALICLVGILGEVFFMACSKLEAMAIYVVKQACDNEIIRVCIDINSIYSRKGLLPMSYPWFLPHFLLICGF